MSTRTTIAQWAGSVRLALLATIALSRRLRLRDTKTPSLTTPDKPAEAHVARRERLLVVDDSKVNQHVASRLLETMGHRVDVASNGLEAVNAVRDQDYAAVLMDCQMPEMDGFEATMEIRRVEGASKRTPIIAMTAGAMKDDEERCMAAGMDAYITKPVNPEQLAGVLSRWIASPDSEIGTWPGASPVDRPRPPRWAARET